MLTWEQSLELEIELTRCWLGELGHEGAMCAVKHVVFFRSEEDRTRALEILEPLGYEETYRDTAVDADFPLWSDIAKRMRLSADNVRQGVLDLVEALRPIGFDYNSFTISVDDGVGPKFFFDPRVDK